MTYEGTNQKTIKHKNKDNENGRGPTLIRPGKYKKSNTMTV